MKIVVVDTETGGLDPNVQSILTLGAVIWNDGVIENSLHLVIREPIVIAEATALKINGLTTEEIEQGMTPATAVETLMRFLRDNGMSGKMILGGHNTPFDQGFLQRLFRLANRAWPFSHRLVDTQMAAMLLLLSGKLIIASTSLDALTNHYNIKVRDGGAEGKHNALEDATATATLLTRLLVDVNPARGGSETQPVS